MSGMSRSSASDTFFLRALIGAAGSCLSKGYALDNQEKWNIYKVNRVFGS